jgi:hypothetical protein
LLDKVSEVAAEDRKSTPSEAADGGEGAEEKQGETVPQPIPVELPADVRSKLRKLDKLESRYQGKWECYILMAMH